MNLFNIYKKKTFTLNNIKSIKTLMGKIFMKQLLFSMVICNYYRYYRLSQYRNYIKMFRFPLVTAGSSILN